MQKFQFFVFKPRYFTQHITWNYSRTSLFLIQMRYSLKSLEFLSHMHLCGWEGVWLLKGIVKLQKTWLWQTTHSSILKARNLLPQCVLAWKDWNSGLMKKRMSSGGDTFSRSFWKQKFILAKTFVIHFLELSVFYELRKILKNKFNLFNKK